MDAHPPALDKYQKAMLEQCVPEHRSTTVTLYKEVPEKIKIKKKTFMAGSPGNILKFKNTEDFNNILKLIRDLRD